MIFASQTYKGPSLARPFYNFTRDGPLYASGIMTICQVRILSNNMWKMVTTIFTTAVSIKGQFSRRMMTISSS